MNEHTVPGPTDSAQCAALPVWLLDLAGIGAQAIRLYAILALIAHELPSRAVLRDRLQVTDVKTVDRALAQLVKAGAVTVGHRWDRNGTPLSSIYEVHTEPPKGIPPLRGVSPQKGIPPLMGIPPKNGFGRIDQSQDQNQTQTPALTTCITPARAGRGDTPTEGGTPVDNSEVHAPSNFRELVYVSRR